MIESVVNMPANYKGTFTCVVNDRDPIIVSRNVVIFLISVLLPPVEAADLMLHVWYSGRIKSSMLEYLRDSVRSLIADVVEKVKNKRDDVLLSKTWLFGPREISVRLHKYEWSCILKMLDSQHEVVRTEKNRLDVMLNASRLDHKERHLCTLTPARRACSHRMRETGVLAPFGYCLERFQYSNPCVHSPFLRSTHRMLIGLVSYRTLFDAETSEWLQQDSADPTDSWPIEAVQSSGSNHGVPKEDWYGRLYFYIRDKLEQFCQKIASGKMFRLHLYCMNATDLPFYLSKNVEKVAFDRIEVANIVDMPYLGLDITLQTCGPLLRTAAENPHATLIALFMNAVYHAEKDLGDTYIKDSMQLAMKKVVQFLPVKEIPINRTSAAMVRMMLAKDIFRDLDHLFTHYMKLTDFSKASREAGMTMRTRNTVIDPWPLRFRKEYGEAGAQEAIDQLMSSSSSGNERYVEWVRSG